MILNIKQNFLDKAISFISPKMGENRLKSKAKIALFNNANGYDQAGSKGKRFLQGIDVAQNSPDHDVLTKQQGSVAISRDSYMNNSLAVSLLNRVRNNTVGTGLKLQSQIDYKFLGIKKEAARKWQENIERKFKCWAESKDCDITRNQNFYELQDLAFFSVLLSGDVFAFFPYKPIKTLSSNVRIRLVESDLCSNPQYQLYDLTGKSDIAGGIELDKDGAPKNYYFSKDYPGANLKIWSVDDWVKIPAFSKSGKKQVHHIFFKDRPGQRRGMPLLSNMINELVKVTKLKDSELTAHVVSSLFTVFVKDMSGIGDPLSEYGEDPFDGQNNAQTGNEDENKLSLGSGNVVYLSNDKEVQIADPRMRTEAHNDFYTSFVKELAAGVGVSYEQLLFHFSSSYSASRGALLEAFKVIRMRRNWLSINFCQPAFMSWLDEQVSSGKILAPGYFENPEIRAAWGKTSWSGMGNGQLDPMKETKAAVMKINNNLSSREKEYNQMHDDGDWNGCVGKLADEKEFLDENDLLPKETTNELTNVKEEETDDTEGK